MHSNETTQVEALTTRISLLMARLEQLVQTVENLEAKTKDAEEEKFWHSCKYPWLIFVV